MKTTIDLPEDILRRSKIAAAQQGTTLKNLVIAGLESVLGESEPNGDSEAAIARLKKGLQLGNARLDRSDIYGR